MDSMNDPMVAATVSQSRLSGMPAMLMGILIGIVLSLACLALISAAVLVNNVGIGTDCKTKNASILDDIRVQTYAPGVFGRGVWTESFTSSPDRVTKTWLSNDLGAVAHLEYLVYDCGYTQSDIQNYFSDASFRTTIFQNYQDVQKTAECSQGSLKLYEFSSTYAKNKYVMFYWLQPENDTRILDLMLAFPADKQTDLQTYAQQIYPRLSACH